MAFTITEECSGCTACVKRCPEAAIRGARDARHVIDERLCIDCGACGPICPREAITDSAGRPVRRQKPKEIPVATVDPDLCSGCGLCEDVCPFASIEVVREGADGASFGIARVTERKCVACRLCVSICIKESIGMGARA